MRPRSDLVLQIASTSDVAKTQAATYSGTLTRLDRLSATTVALGVEIPNRAELAFLPGQYVNIAVPGTDQTRSYSFSNSPQDDLLTFLVKLTPGGAMSEYLTRARVGRRQHLVHRSQRIVLPPGDRPPGVIARRRHGIGPGAVDAAHPAGRLEPAQGSPDLRCQHRRRPGGARRDRRDRRDPQRILLGFLCLRPAVDSATQRLRGKPHQTGAPVRRRRRGLSLRTATDGGVGAHPCDESRYRADGLLLREVRAGPRRRRT